MKPSTAEIEAGAPIAGKPHLPPLEPIAPLLAAWAEREAIRADGAGSWRPGELAAAADDRRRPPTDPNESLTFGPEFAAPPPTTRLGLRRDVKSADPPKLLTTPAPDTTSDATGSGPRTALDRYVGAIGRVDAAYGVVEGELEAALADLQGHWSARAQQQADGVRRKLEAVRGRREALRECTIGNVRVTRFRCRCCGATQCGPPAGCNSRVCPRCVKKRRLEAMAKVGGILDELDQARRAEGRPLPRWRFATLTAPSWSAFRPMRLLLGEAVVRLQRRALWSDRVAGSIIAWETTHTRAGWHVHAHALLDAWLPRAALARAWQQSVAQEFAVRIRRGLVLVGAPASVLELSEQLQPDVEGRQQFARAVGRLVRWAEARGLELREAAAAAPASVVGAWQQVAGRRRRRLVRDFRPELEQLARACPSPAGVNLKELGGSRSRVLSELAKYAGKDLGGAQVDDAGEWGIAGTPARLAEFISGAWRWRTLRTYGECYRRTARTGHLECDACGNDGLEFDGTTWLPDDQAAELERDRRARRRELAELRGRAPPLASSNPNR